MVINEIVYFITIKLLLENRIFKDKKAKHIFICRMLEGLEKELVEEEGKEDETEDVCTELFDLNLPQQLKSGLETDFANISGSFE